MAEETQETAAFDMAAALELILSFMDRNAKAVSEKQKAEGKTPHYAAKIHAVAAGKVMAAIVAKGVQPTAENMTILFHSLANHSAWRQKFEGKGYYPKAEKAGSAADPKKATDKLAKLGAEMAEANIGEEV